MQADKFKDSAIVGYTGFVGSNLCLSHDFMAKYNSKNIESAFGTEPDFLVYSGIRAEMFLANNFPEQDAHNIEVAISNIRKISPKNIILISTISVYDNLIFGDENTIINKGKLSPYGKNRLVLEEWVKTNCPSSLIVRLPAIYGENLKKNFIYDIIHYIPTMLDQLRWQKYLKGTKYETAYQLNDMGYYKCIVSDPLIRKELKTFFQQIGFSALNFTDSRSIYQYYNLNRLWRDIEIAINNNIGLLTIATEPITAAELFEAVYNAPFSNECNQIYPKQGLKSIHAAKFGGSNGWLLSKQDVLTDLVDFIKQHIKSNETFDL